MRFDIVTIFPRMVEAFLAEGVVGRAVVRGVLQVAVHDLRDFTVDRHRSVDDVPYGGGPGMVMKPEPLMLAVDTIRREWGSPRAVILASPQGKLLSHAAAVRLSRLSHLVILCGRYEGVDERVCEYVASEELSIGDYVLSGGELPAAVIVDVVARHVPGVVGNDDSVEGDSFVRNLLNCPHYTRPTVVDRHRVPDVLLSGNHAAIRRWRKREAIRRTFKRRPDLLTGAILDDEEQEFLREFEWVSKRETGAGA